MKNTTLVLVIAVVVAGAAVLWLNPDLLDRGNDVSRTDNASQ